MASSPKFTPFQCQAIFNEALAAGILAGNGAKCETMYVGTPKSIFSNEIDTTKRVYEVPDGVCGFSWIKIKPSNSSFANWLKKTGKGRKSYQGGVEVSVFEHRQSLTRKENHAHAFAEVLRKYGIDAYADSRID